MQPQSVFRSPRHPVRIRQNYCSPARCRQPCQLRAQSRDRRCRALEREFLLCIQRCYIPDVARVEIGQDAYETLLLFCFHLHFGDHLGGADHDHLLLWCDRQLNAGHVVGLPSGRCELRRRIRLEALHFGRNQIGPTGQLAEGEFAILRRYQAVVFQRANVGEGDLRTRNAGSVHV